MEKIQGSKMKKGIILHGGYGTRLRPFTFSRPKQLLPIANIPMSQFGLIAMKNAGITEIAIIIGGENSFKVKEFYGDGGKFGVNITYVNQEKPLGISHAIGLCQEFIDNEKFVVFLGDNILLKEITDYVKKFNSVDDAAKILLCEVLNPQQFGIADVSKDGNILKIMEKPKNPPTNLAVIGIYFFTPKIFQIIKKLKPSWRNELEITDALQIMLEDKEKISYEIITNYWKDTGTIEDILDANKKILGTLNSNIVDKKNANFQMDGKLIIGNNTIISQEVKIIGPVIIGDNSHISGPVTIGPNVSIGNNCKINECSIENSIIMDNCEIKCKKILTNSIVSYDSKITSSENEKISRLLIGEQSKLTF